MALTAFGSQNINSLETKMSESRALQSEEPPVHPMQKLIFTEFDLRTN